MKRSIIHNQELETAYQNAIIGSIARPMIHDLASPLSALKGAVKLLEDKDLQIDQVERHEILTHANEAINQIDKIICNSKNLIQGKKTLVEFSPKEKIINLLFIISNKLDTNHVNVKLSLSSKCKIYGMVTLFERIIMNVLQNAVEELISDEVKPGKRKIIELQDKQDGGYYILQIKDNGQGIPEEHLNEIFKPVFTLKNKSHLGLGLSFVKQYTEEYFSGSVELTSKPGKYTLVTLKFKIEN